MSNSKLSSALLNRVAALKAGIPTSEQETVSKAFEHAKGDWAATLKELQPKFSKEQIAKVDFAHSLAAISGDNSKTVKALISLPHVNSMRELALNYSTKQLREMISADMVPAGIKGADQKTKIKNYTAELMKHVFAQQPSAVLQRMASNGELPIKDTTIRNNVGTFLSNQPDFNIGTTSVYKALQNPDALKGIDEQNQAVVIDQVKTLQRLQAISPTPETLTILMSGDLPSAYHVAEMTESSFLSTYSEALGEEEAKQVYYNATNIKIRNEQAVRNVTEVVYGSGIAVIDGNETYQERIEYLNSVSSRQGVKLNWEALFGSVDFCECESCNSIYSPAAYFVELLQYLRNNNLDNVTQNSDGTLKYPNAGQKGISGTPLEKFFNRRPDLGCLELTCTNTNTILPYIDLVNEVMESFVVHLEKFKVEETKDGIIVSDVIDVWNTEDETTGELLAQPQHTNYDAYCILKKAVYPFTLPYHQPIDAIRIFLDFLGTSRYELMEAYRTSAIAKKEDSGNGPCTIDEPVQVQDKSEFISLNEKATNRALDAEYLGLTQEEYIILTKEAFWTKEYFDIKCDKVHTTEEYRKSIGLKNVWEYYGYGSEADMSSPDTLAQSGLMFVKAQFLKRTGILYTDLVELLKTRFINPLYPQGKSLAILESLKFSYRFLQTLVDTNSSDPKIRYKKLVEFLKIAQPVVPMLEALLHPDPCHANKIEDTIETKELEKWIYCNFEKLGKLIVLESGDEPYIPMQGDLYVETKRKVLEYIGTFNSDGKITDKDNKEIGYVDQTGKVVVNGYSNSVFCIKDGNTIIGIIDSDGYIYRWDEFASAKRDQRKPASVSWKPPKDTCNVEKVRLQHLDGTNVTAAEYDKIHRFIRLWRKMGWTIDETDKAVTGLGCYKGNGGKSESCKDDADCFEDFTDDCECKCDEKECCCSDESEKYYYDITPALLHQFAALKELLDITGLELIKLLVFWANISTAGKKSLYARLFLTHNMIGIDKIFKADTNGNYLSASEKITDHIPVVMAALNLKAEDIYAIMDFGKIPDELTLANISGLYRHSLLMKVLHVKSDELRQIILLFGNPFGSADTTRIFFKVWARMEDAGFTFRQLNYVINNYNDEKKPLAPKRKAMLQLSKAIYEGLNQIDKDHPDIANDDEATSDFVRTTISLLFDTATTEKIMGLLEGSTIYTINAPVNLVSKQEDFISKLTGTLITKLKYDFAQGSIQVTGILTDTEKTTAKALFNDAEWISIFDRINKQSLYFYKDVIASIFPEPDPGQPDDAKNILLQGDSNIPDAQQDPQNPIANTAPLKRAYFVKTYLPFLREHLEHKFLTDTMSGQLGTTAEITDVLLTEVIKDIATKQPVFDILRNVKNQPPSVAPWKGYLILAADDSYIFAITINTASLTAGITLDGQALSFVQQEDPNNVWLSEPIKLKAGTIYTLEVTGLSPDLKELTWKTPITTKSALPASVLFPDDSVDTVQNIVVQLQKASLFIKGFSLTKEEVVYLQNHATDFGGFDFNSFTLQHWQRLEAFARLNKSLPATNTDLVSFFTWITQASDNTLLSAKIAELTLWKQEDIDKLIASDHYNLSIGDFKNEQNLLKLQKALYVADKISMDINLLFDWAKPTSKFWLCHKIAESIRITTKARYSETDWEQVAQPLNDKLRSHQRDALISYLLVQPDLIKWGVEDADSLFEFFLIDVQMDACMQTSRIKQAINSVQLFVQRCFLGLEEKYGVANDKLDRKRWEWMQREVLWTANRKVFLYPENWIEEKLRDDKSAFFKELESELLQKDIDTQTVHDALKSYLYKLDEVASMRVAGLTIDKEGQKIHIFSRTRNAPYTFYYRHYKINQKSWTSWEKVQIDIPSYDVEEESSKQLKGNGCYLIPVAYNNRLLIFFPQIMKKTKTPDNTAAVTIKGSGDTKLAPAIPSPYWEVKLGWSELRNGKWTQKQLSKEALYDETFSAINKFNFIPDVSEDSGITIMVINESKTVILNSNNTFQFKGNTLSLGSKKDVLSSSLPDNFHYTSSDLLYSMQKYSSQLGTDTMVGGSDFEDNGKSISLSLGSTSEYFEFYHPYIHEFLSKIESNELVDFFECGPNFLEDPISDSAQASAPSDIEEMFGKKETASSITYNELTAPYSIYNWELFFHTPVTLAINLSQVQNFEEAMKWFHYVFNPLAKGKSGVRFWRFWPFQQANAKNYLENLFNGLNANTPDAADGQITAWRNNPFQPHIIARERPSAYMKWVVMKYLDNLIAWGDYLFTQHTIESINQATQLYILASHILGKRPMVIPKRGKIKPETYNSLLDKWDAFGNAVVELELIFPFSNQITFPVAIQNNSVGFANVYGFASSLYFCIPGNPKLTEYWDTIEDRLYKIRHCETIEGVFSLPPLWDPPIDPALLVRAAAQGISIANVLNDLSTPMPNYRFSYLIQKAIELCSELKSMGNSVLSTYEKQDSETLAVMRSKHENIMNNLIMEVKKNQLEEANKALEGLEQNRKAPVSRMQYYLKLIGQDIGKVPSEDGDFAELANQIEAPIDDSGLKLIAYEKEEMDKAGAAADFNRFAGMSETLAGTLHLIPNFVTDVKPWGVGAGITWGGAFLGSAAQAVAKGLQVRAGDLSYASTSAGRKAGFLRQLQDRVFQANNAGFEIKQIDKQIIGQKIRIQIASQEINNQQQAIDNSAEAEDFLRSKYTNAELYSWMRDSLKPLYYQVYKLAYELAKKAEAIYRFERGLTSSDFIRFGYWDASRDGLLSGEQLYVGIKQLEAAYQQKRGYDYEITKNISLRQISPLALLQLKETGSCEIEIPEILFDMDFPGQYMRKIKSVSLSVPCIVGPYTGVNATLRLLENKIRINALAKDKADYPESTESADERFTTVNVPVTSIAVSNGQSDSGVFELNFKDERFMPFEGAGTISKWRLELPSEFRQFDYNTITDVIIHMRYTSIEGGGKLKNAATEFLKTYIASVEDLSQKEGLFAIFDIQHDFPNEWYKAVQMPLPAGATSRNLQLSNLADRLPVFTRGFKSVAAVDVILLTSSSLQAGAFTLSVNGDDNSFANGVKIGKYNAFAMHDADLSLTTWDLSISDTQTDISDMWMVVRYTLKS